MKSIIFIILVVMSYSIFADDITTTDGLTYKNATVAKMTADTMVISVDIPRSKLSDSVWSKYANINKQKTDAINIKGLYLGMPLEAAREIGNQCARKMGQKEITHNNAKLGLTWGTNEYGAWSLEVTFDEKLQAIKIEANASWIDTMFNAQNMSFNDFKNTFSQYFNIPVDDYRLVTYENIFGWLEYKSPEGFVLRWFPGNNKALILEKSVTPVFE